MPLRTTCIGAYPKPDYLPIRDWFQVHYDAEDHNELVTHAWAREKVEAEQSLFDRATAEVIADQISCGIDIPTDGEVRRENYVHYQCRHFAGFDFMKLTKTVMRNGAYTVELPTIRAPIKATNTNALVRDWQIAETAAKRPVKMTIPGPMTIADTTADAYYNDDAKLARDLADALNQQVLALADAGCQYIQIDEPIFARKPEAALGYGVETLERCFHNAPQNVSRVAHMCCGYPNHLDDADYPKADPQSYIQIAKAVDQVVDQLSIEDAHRFNPDELFKLFERTTLIVGFIKIASSTVETVDEIHSRMQTILDFIPQERLIAAPDCGLGYLGRDLAMTKLRNMCVAAQRF